MRQTKGNPLYEFNFTNKNGFRQINKSNGIFLAQGRENVVTYYFRVPVIFEIKLPNSLGGLAVECIQGDFL